MRKSAIKNTESGVDHKSEQIFCFIHLQQTENSYTVERAFKAMLDRVDVA